MIHLMLSILLRRGALETHVARRNNQIAGGGDLAIRHAVLPPGENLHPYISAGLHQPTDGFPNTPRWNEGIGFTEAIWLES